MSIAATTLNGNRCTDVRCTIPAWGTSYHDVSLDVEVSLAGAVTLMVSDLTVHGTILSGGPAVGRSFYRVVSGAGGWGKNLPKTSYANDLGVKLGAVLGDAASAVGETLDTTSFVDVAIGPSFVRRAGPACRLLEQLAPSAWYIGEDGKTRLGARPATTLAAKAARVSQKDLARGTLTLASETIATILPGITVDGLTAIDVEHEVSLKGGLRTKLWGTQGGAASRRLSALRKILDQLDPNRNFRGVTEYRVVTQNGERLNLQPVRVSTGMPDLSRVYVRPGVPGCRASVTLGERVLVGFVDSDPSRPYVSNHEDAEGAGFVPISLTLATGIGGGSAVGRMGDQVTLTTTQIVAAGFTTFGAGPPYAVVAANNAVGTITGGSAKVRCG